MPLRCPIRATPSRPISAQVVRPSVFHQGNRGLERDRIQREAELFSATKAELAQPNPALPNPYRGIPAERIHQKLRPAMLGKFPWLAQAETARISPWERATDLTRLFVFMLGVLFAFSLPGLLLLVFLQALHPVWAQKFMALDYGPFLGLLILPALAGSFLYATGGARRGEAAPTRSGGFSLSTANEVTSFANPFTLVAAALLTLALLIVTMSVVGAGAMTLLKLSSKAIHSTESFDHILYAAPQSFIAAFAQNWHPIVKSSRWEFTRRLYFLFRQFCYGSAGWSGEIRTTTHHRSMSTNCER